MLASKGLLRGASAVSMRRIPQFHASTISRQFSSLRPSTPFSACLPSTRPIAPLVPLVSLRFNSTAANPAPVPSPAESSALPDLSSTDFSAIKEAISSEAIPKTEYIGYLKDIGLDFGHGTTTLVQWLLEHVHIYSGTPWWGSVLLTVGLIRLVQFPFYVRMSDNAARMKEVNPLAVPITQKMRAAQMRQDTMGMVLAKQELGVMYKKAGVNRLWLLFPITQIPIFYGFYKNLHAMAELPVPALTEANFLWIHDLTNADPYFLLPLATSAALFTQLSFGGEAGSTQQTRQLKLALTILLPGMTLLFTYKWAAILTLYFCANSMIGLIQTLLFRWEWFRSLLGIYPMNPEASKNPLSVKPAVPQTPLSALNIASHALPKKPVKPEEKSSVRQIGGKGSWLDRITGGAKDAEKKAEESGFSLNSITGSPEERKHTAYEKKREARLAEQRKNEKLERERRRRAKAE
ncbi:hypothetical protein RUND412_010179 [Rhizina undulata]